MRRHTIIINICHDGVALGRVSAVIWLAESPTRSSGNVHKIATKLY